MFYLKDTDENSFHNEGKETDRFLSVSSAVKFTGYNNQYLRRLLRAGKLIGVRIGQVWLINFQSLEEYLHSIESKVDHRCGPKN